MFVGDPDAAGPGPTPGGAPSCMTRVPTDMCTKPGEERREIQAITGLCTHVLESLESPEVQLMNEPTFSLFHKLISIKPT